jgi:hypothetical protein
LKPERWGSVLVEEEKYREEKGCDNRDTVVVMMMIR